MCVIGFGRRVGVLLLVFSVFLATESAMADGSWGSQGGSWGSSSGSWGSQGGSWGSCGGSQGGVQRARWTPIRNMIGRHRARYARRFAGGSSGYYTGGSSGGAYSSFGSSGTRSYGSSGGSWGSRYSSSYPGSSYGNWGPYTNQADASSYYYESPITSGGVIQGDSGLGIPIESSPSLNSFGTPGQIIPDDGIPKSVIESDSVVPSPGGVDPNRLETPPSPGPALAPSENTGEIVLANPADAVLSVRLPLDAKLRINGRLTRTEGELRRFVSHRLKSGKRYDFRVQAIFNRNGKEIVRNQNVKLASGTQKSISFDFDQPAVTTLAVRVPSDARVTLSGHETSPSSRTTRYFKTRSLTDGESWKDYKIQVSVIRNGKKVTREKTVNISAGEIRLIAFDFDSAGRIAQK